MTNVFQTSEKAKSIAEHITIILKYQQIGIFNRDRALEICKRFNVENPEYSSIISAAAIATNNLTSIDTAPDSVLINNLILQASWTMGEEYLKTIGITV